jgi:predicted nucleic acid-binding protein
VTAATYLDSSALVKLVIAEPESASLRRHLRRRRPLVSSALARTEVLRALLDEGPEATARAHALFGRVDLLRINDRVLDSAGTLLPSHLRSLDAIHLASALQLGTDLGALVSYDQRMLDAARHLGINIASPR